MADRKISDLTALTTPASGDYLPIVDISEASAANKNKRITIEELLRGAPDGTAAAPGIAFESDPNTGIYCPGADALGVVTGGTEQLRITSDRYVRLASGSGGIQFNGDTAAANALDDYEEGAWTPVHSDAANTTATLTGLYRKIGSVVYVRVVASGTGTLKVGSVSGLPFTNIATIVGTGGKVSHTTSATSDTSVVGYQANAAVINLNLSADVSVNASASWVASITAVVF